MIYEYQTHGVCSRHITIDIAENGIINDVTFISGCDGNLKGISALVKGKKAEDIIPALEGITCGFKKTSCPNELATALKEALEKIK